MRYLVIPAHPDDGEFLCGGTVAKLAKEGNVVYYCNITSGQRGISGKSIKESAKIREAEQLNASKVLGVREVIFLGFMDGEVENTPKLRKKIVEVIRLVKPDVVMTFDPAHKYDNYARLHPDHRRTAETVFDVLYPAVGNDSYYPELIKKGFKPHTVKEAWFFGSDNPTDYIDITKTIKTKLQALREHKSQVKEHEFEKRVMHWAGETGKKAKVKYAESFRKLKLWR
ncbi:MAG: PIG-L family deacetylase [Candidatus Aenigmarchaeota archaeon]|nr:PIG-L family deacetylase [Candidatus Aenigmarchaeota archaeon]